MVAPFFIVVGATKLLESEIGSLGLVLFCHDWCKGWRLPVAQICKKRSKLLQTTALNAENGCDTPAGLITY